MSSNWAESSQDKAAGFLHSIPGYSGYKDKERRRDADKQVREKLAAALSTQADRVERIARDLATQRRLAEIGPVDTLAKLLRHTIDRIATATYGYGGIFSERPIKEQALDQIRIFDESLFASVDALKAPIGALEQAASSKQDLSAPAAAVTDIVQRIGGRLDARKEIIDSGQPAGEAQVAAALDVLKTPAQQTAEKAPPPVYDLHDKDALAILGDNFIVDSRIDVVSSNQSFRLFRVDAAPDRWLLAPKQPGMSLALLTTSQDAFTEQPPAIGGTAYSIESSGSGTSEIAGAGGASAPISVAYWLLKGAGNPAGRAVVLKWTGQTQVMTGVDVHPDDVEIFGAPPSP